MLSSAEYRGEGSRTKTLGSLAPSRFPMEAGTKDRHIFLTKQVLSWGIHISYESRTTHSREWATGESWHKKSELKTPWRTAMAESNPRQGGGYACLSRAFVKAGEAHECSLSTASTLKTERE